MKKPAKRKTATKRKPNAAARKAKPAAKKTIAKKGLAKAKPVKKAKPSPIRAAAAPPLPRKQDVPGYSPSAPDMAAWPEVAVVLKVRPFYVGPDSVPFSRLRAHLVPDPTRGNKTFNDFFLDHG